MGLILPCLIFVVLTSTSAYNEHFYKSITQMIRESSVERPNERQKMNETSIAVNSGVQRVQELEKLHTRMEETVSRAENTSYKILNTSMNPEQYPLIANKIGMGEHGGLLVSPSPTSSFHASTKRFKLDIPAECETLGICEKIKNYPYDVVESLIKELGDKIKSRLSVEALKEPKRVQRLGPGENNIDLCQVNETVLIPQAARADSNEWFVILNQKDVPLQGYRAEICNTTGSCDNFINFVFGYKAHCKQKYIFRTMAAVDVDNRKVIYDKIFRVPSCCSCVASQS